MNDEVEIRTERPAWMLATPARRDELQQPNGLRALLVRLMRGQHLDRKQAGELLGAMLDGKATDAQIAAALVALAVKGETIEELAGMAGAMRQRGTRITSKYKTVLDTAGTGSSAVKTFNVSTAAAFVIAAAGVPVAKHGSRAATSKSGSADVLAQLGVNVNTAPQTSADCLNELGICFMFAPLYHAATARVASVRRELGVHTTFNLLGPLTNPARASRQIIGVWHAALVEPLARTLGLLGCERAWVVHGSDGLDEVTLAGSTYVAETSNGKVRTFDFTPHEFGLKPASLANIRDNDAEKSAAIIRDVLTGKRTDATRDLVIINAAAGLVVGGAASDFRDAADIAQRVIDSGAAQAKLRALVDATNR
ncbi:MAG TPA: anthranilate phosphoribosyltransferase [Pyrinomonadaceae bacterium]|nr:anthranilate phosphoribosyltransferase [Pyrinomonadaceae bacterium]